DAMSEEELPLRALPEGVEHELSSASTFANAPWDPAEGDGRTLFDTPQSADGTILAVFPQSKFDAWRSQALAHGESRGDGRTALARVVRGPYAAPIGLSATTPALVVTQVENSLFTPPYHGWAALAILGEVRDGQTHLPLYRPRPNSRVRLLGPEETKAALGCDGDLRLGRAVGYPEIPVGLQSNEKHHVPRHTLAVGTTGAGKSTFLAGWIEKLSQAGFCVIVLDVEAEYTAIDQPADSDRILPALTDWGLEAAGVPNTYLLVPTGAATRNPEHPRVRRFALEFSNVSPHVAVELLRGNEAQSDRFQLAYEAASDLVTQLKLTPDMARHRDALRDWDDQERGYPDLRLAHVLDVAEAAAALVGGEDGIDSKYLHDDGFKGHTDALKRKAGEVKKRQGHIGSWRKTVSLI